MVIDYFSLGLQTAIAKLFPRSTWPHYKRAYSFTSDWFTPRIMVWKKVMKDLNGRPNLNALEIGTYEGRSSIWLLENILTHSGSRLVCIDLFFDKGYENRFTNNLRLSQYEKKVSVFSGHSQSILPKLTPSNFDLVYIDGSHEAEDVFRDAKLCWPLIKLGGLLIFDDYLWKENETMNRPKNGIDSFLNEAENQFEFLHRGYQIIIRKIGIQNTIDLI